MKKEIKLTHIFPACLFLILCLNTPLWAQDNAKLIEYIMYQEFDKAKDLIKNGADINYQDESSGSTALMLSCQYNFTDMAQFLVEHGADLNVQSDNGQTALMASARTSEELFNLLISKGADVTIMADDGTTAFTQACMGALQNKVPLSVVQKILDLGADVDESATSGPTEGYTCLMMAARNNQLELAKLLVENGADVNKKAEDGKSALALSVEEDNSEMTAFLKGQGAKE